MAEIIEVSESESIVAGTAQQVENKDRTKQLLALELLEGWGAALQASKLKIFWVSVGVRCALLDMHDFGYGARTVWGLELKILGKMFSKAVSDKLGVPVYCTKL